jgi:hypothetical protein
MVGERHGMCESNTAAQCKSNLKPLQNGMVGERHGDVMVCVNRPLEILLELCWRRLKFSGCYAICTGGELLTCNAATIIKVTAILTPALPIAKYSVIKNFCAPDDYSIKTRKVFSKQLQSP